MKEQFTHFEDYNFIESLKTKSPIPFINSIIKILNDKEKEQLKGFFEDEESSADLLLLFDKVSDHFHSENLPEFLLNVEKKLETFVAPEYKNDRAVAEFFFFVRKIYKKKVIPRQKLIQKKSIVDDFNVNPDTLNEWLLFFEKEKYIGRRDFDGLEWAEIVGDFIKVGDLKLEDLAQYHFYSYNKITIAKIIGDLSKGDKTQYRNLGLQTEEIDDLNPENKKFLLWLKSHNKLPFSLAYRYISLLLEGGKNDTSVESIFANYKHKDKK